MPHNDLTAPPIAARIPHPTTLHHTTLKDDYAWLREKGTPAVQAYLEAENAYTSAAMAGTEVFQKDLYDEILSHIQEDDASVPYRDGAWEYLTRTEKGRQYARYCRYPVGRPTDENIFLDVNELAEGQAYMSLGGLAMSPDGQLLAYTTDTTGFRQYTLHLRDLKTGEERSEGLGGRLSDAFLHHRGRADQAAGPALPACAWR
jgi:oligopeptidase B